MAGSVTREVGGDFVQLPQAAESKRRQNGQKINTLIKFFLH